MNHPPFDQLADSLRTAAKIIDQHGCPDTTRHRTGNCRCLTARARLLGSASVGFPSATLGDGTGSRTSDTTSTTERAALNPDPWANIDFELNAALTNIWTASLTVLTLVDRINAHAPDDDPLPAGTGPCTIRTCDTTCRPDNKRPDNRLKSGLCPACWVSWNKHLRRNPGATLVEWRTTRTAALRPKPVAS